MVTLIAEDSPGVIGEMVDTMLGKIVVVMVALSLFGAHPVVGAIGLVAAYQLILRSQGQQSMAVYVPSEAKKSRVLTAMNQFPTTIEEQVIANQIPYVFKLTAPGNMPYKGVQDKLHGAAKVNASD